jgi:hypothetical protein
MEIYPVKRNTHLAAIYCNKKKSNMYRINVDVMLSDLKHQPEQFNGPHDARMVANVEYRHPWVA